jgi:hypothetical protein
VLDIHTPTVENLDPVNPRRIALAVLVVALVCGGAYLGARTGAADRDESRYVSRVTRTYESCETSEADAVIADWTSRGWKLERREAWPNGRSHLTFAKAIDTLVP